MSFQLTAARESAASFGTLRARRCVAPLTRLSISKPLPSSLAAHSMMRAEVKYSPVPPEPSTEARSRTLLIIGLPGSRTNVVPDEAPPNNPYEPQLNAGTLARPRHLYVSDTLKKEAIRRRLLEQQLSLLAVTPR